MCGLTLNMSYMSYMLYCGFFGLSCHSLGYKSNGQEGLQVSPARADDKSRVPCSPRPVAV